MRKAGLRLFRASDVLRGPQSYAVMEERYVREQGGMRKAGLQLFRASDVLRGPQSYAAYGVFVTCLANVRVWARAWRASEGMIKGF